MYTQKRDFKITEVPQSILRIVEIKLRTKFPRWLGLREGLAKLAEHDLETLRMVGLEPEDISSKLRLFVRGYLERRSKEKGDIEFPPSFLVIGKQYRGWAVCPFEGRISKPLDYSDEHPGALTIDMCSGEDNHGTFDFTIKNTLLDDQIFFGDLNLHLIEAHHFFESTVNKYRLDPLKAAYVLGLIDRATYEKWKERERLYDYRLLMADDILLNDLQSSSLGRRRLSYGDLAIKFENGELPPLERDLERADKYYKELEEAYYSRKRHEEKDEI